MLGVNAARSARKRNHRRLDRILNHLLEFESSDASGHVEQIIGAIDLLAHSPMVGRPTKNGLRELVIGTSGRGYVALYRYVPHADGVYVLAIRG